MRAKTPVIDLGQKPANRGLLCEKHFLHLILILAARRSRDGMQQVLLAVFVCFLPSILMVAWLVWQAHGRGVQAS